MKRKYVKNRVSVIVPVYNAEKHIGKALKSVFAQTYRNIEIVMVDDQSTDHSSEIIKQYQKEYSYITYYLLDRNMGAGAARNKALELACGQYVAFLDADDLWHPQKVEKQVKLLKDKNGAFSYTAIQMVDGDGKVVKTKRKVREQVDYKFLLHNTMIATSTVMIDRMKLGDFRMPLRRGGQDYAAWLMLLRDGTVAYGIDEALGNYRIGNRDSLAGKKSRSIRQVWEIQTQDEQIGKISAAYNLCCFVVNAAKKYLL